MDPFRILGVDRSASPEEIDAAYCELCRRYRPGRASDDYALAQLEEAHRCALMALDDDDDDDDEDDDEDGEFDLLTEDHLPSTIRDRPDSRNGHFPEQGEERDFSGGTPTTEPIRDIEVSPRLAGSIGGMVAGAACGVAAALFFELHGALGAALGAVAGGLVGFLGSSK